MISFINEKDSYQRIILLALEHQNLKNENKLLKQQQEKLQEHLENGYELEEY